MNEDIIQEVAKRTKGEIYLGVVGAVRTGKSTFIRKFMENMVIPNIIDEEERKRTTGKKKTTTEEGRRTQ